MIEYNDDGYKCIDEDQTCDDSEIYDDPSAFSPEELRIMRGAACYCCHYCYHRTACRDACLIEECDGSCNIDGNCSGHNCSAFLGSMFETEPARGERI